MPHLNEPGAPEIPYASAELADGRCILLLPWGWRQPERQYADRGPLTTAQQDDAWAVHAYWMEHAAETGSYRHRATARARRRGSR